MKKIKKILIVMFLFTLVVKSQDMQQNAFQSLFSDYKASRIGDAVTILVVESSRASNRASTSAGKTSDLGFNASMKMAQPSTDVYDFDIGSKNNFKGSGATQSQGMVRTRLSARIDSIFSNGDLRIKGSRKIVINGEEQMILIKGIVRRVDIKPDNSVYSYNVSDMEIIIEGKGKIDDAQSPGWLTKLFHWLF